MKQILEKISTGVPRKSDRINSIVISIFAVLITIYQFWNNLFASIDPYLRNAVFVLFMLAILFLVYSPNKKGNSKVSVFDYFFSGTMVLAGVYIIANSDRYLSRWSLVDPLSTFDVVLAAIISIVVLEATRRTLGLGFLVFVALLLGYFFFGHLLTGAFFHPKYDILYFFDKMIFTYEGVFGQLASVLSTYVFFFVLFGSVFSHIGGGNFFHDISNAIAGKSAGGPAKVAVVSSGLYGMISGSAVSDVLTTGTFTIPAMKRAGFPSVIAGAIEAVAASGGSILPPIMGTAAFLMVELTGIPYTKVAMAALVPALFYYFAVFIQVDLTSRKLGLKAKEENVDTVIGTLRKQGYYLLPMVVLVAGIGIGYSPVFSAILGTVTCVTISFFKKETMLTLKRMIIVITETAVKLASLVAVIGAAGLIVGSIMLTGFGGKLSGIVQAGANGNLFIALILTMVVCMMFGMGMPVVAAYILTTILTLPVLLDMGVPILSAHLFIIYFTTFSSITPPVAVAAFAAASIAEANPMKIGFTAVKLGIVGFIVPFLFIYKPELMLQGSFIDITSVIVATMIGVIGMAVAWAGYCFENISLYERGGFLTGGVLTLLTGWLQILGIILLFAISFYKLREVKKQKQEVLNCE